MVAESSLPVYESSHAAAAAFLKAAEFMTQFLRAPRRLTPPFGVPNVPQAAAEKDLAAVRREDPFGRLAKDVYTSFRDPKSTRHPFSRTRVPEAGLRVAVLEEEAPARAELDVVAPIERRGRKA